MSQPSKSQQKQNSASKVSVMVPLHQHGQLPVKFGRYELTRMLGIGGMGTVYLADDTALQRQVALKIPNRISDEGSLQRLLQEARAAAKIHHPNVCSLLDIGCEAGQPYLTMEYVEGKSLDKYLSAGNQIPIEQVARILLKISAGVHAAHQKGVIHRDLKPANILLRDHMDPIITDFGLAINCDQVNAEAAVGKLQGSPAYMSPEQIRCDFSRICPATDVYGLGAILYELISGKRPFDAEVPAIYSQVLTQDPQPFSNRCSPLGVALESICMRALSKSPFDRYLSVADFSQAIAACVRDDANRQAASPLSPPSLPVAASPERPTPPRTLNPTKKSDLAIYRASTRPINRRSPRRPKGLRRRVGTASGIIAVVVLSSVMVLSSGYWMRVALERSQPHPSAIEPTPDSIDKPRRNIDSEQPLTNNTILHDEQISQSTSSAATPMATSIGSLETAEHGATMSDDHPPATVIKDVFIKLSEPIDPSGAIVTIDDERFSPEMLAYPISLESGSHTITMVSADTEFLSHEFSVKKSGPSNEVHLNLVRREGEIRLRITRLYASDQIKIDGQSITLKRLSEPLSLPTGQHKLSISRLDSPEKTKTFWVVPGKNPDLRIFIKPAKRLGTNQREATARSSQSDSNDETVELPRLAGEIRGGNCLGMQMSWCSTNQKSNSQLALAESVDGFWMGRYAVTKAQWSLLMDTTPWKTPSWYPQRSRVRRAHAMSWQQANEFAKKLTRIENERGRIDQNWEYALPTQTQWEYAMSAGKNTATNAALADADIPTDTDETNPSHPGVNSWGICFHRSGVYEFCRDGKFQRKANPNETPYTYAGLRLVLVPRF